jgi:hypothetical protein
LKKLIYLINTEIRRFRWPLIGIMVLLVFFQQVLLGISADNNFRYVPYEEFFNSSGAIIVFGFAFAACCTLSIWTIVYNYHGSKSIYTLMTLPQNRSQLYLSKLITCLMFFLILLTTQLLSALLGYIIFAPKIQRPVEELYATVRYDHAKNGLFLSFIRSNFFRLLFPLGLKSFISSISILFAFVVGLLYGVLCERSKSYYRLILVTAHMGYSIYLVNYRITATDFFQRHQSLTIHSVLMLLITAFFIWDSMKLVRSSAIS